MLVSCLLRVNTLPALRNVNSRRLDSEDRVEIRWSGWWQAQGQAEAYISLHRNDECMRHQRDHSEYDTQDVRLPDCGDGCRLTRSLLAAGVRARTHVAVARHPLAALHLGFRHRRGGKTCKGRRHCPYQHQHEGQHTAPVQHKKHVTCHWGLGQCEVRGIHTLHVTAQQKKARSTCERA